MMVTNAQLTMVNYDIDDNNVNGNNCYHNGQLTMVNYEAMTIMLMTMMVTKGELTMVNYDINDNDVIGNSCYQRIADIG